MRRNRASIFTSCSESYELQRPKAPPPIPPPAPQQEVIQLPPVDSTVEKAQVLVSNYISEQLERTGREQPVIPTKRPKTVEQEEDKYSVPPFLLESRGTAQALVDIVGRQPDVRVISDTGNREDVEALFSNRLKTNGRVIDEFVASVPTPQECAAVIDRLEQGTSVDDTGKWTKLYVGLSIDKNLEIPRLGSLAVSDIVDFLRPPDPSAVLERPCKPLIDSRTNMPRTCESVLMGSPKPLREFLLPSMVHSKQLPKFQRCCFLCMQRFVTVEWAKRRARKNDDTEGNDEWRIILHDYEMIVNRPNGFNGKLLIPFTGRPCGVAGTVISHDTTMYVPRQFPKGAVGWRFSDEMLFRPGATKGL